MSEKVVYLVTSGEYSDYRVNAAFTDREAAEAYAEWLNGPDPGHYGIADVEEYALDEPTPTTGRWCIGGPYEDWDAGDVDALGAGWWNEDSSEKTHAHRDGGGGIWIAAYGKDRDRALRSGRNLARSIKAGTVVVP